MMSLGRWLFKVVCNYYSKETKTAKRSYLCDFDRVKHEIIPGDVLLVEGTNRISRYIKAVTHSPWTHVTIYIGRIHSIVDPKIREMVRKHYPGSADQQLIVDTVVGKGTFIKSVDEYKDHHVRICRPINISHNDAQQVINFVVKHVGKNYNLRHFFDLARFLLKAHWFIPRRWRSSLFTRTPSKTTKDICSGVIADAFQSIHFPILPLIREKDQKNLEIIPRNSKLFTPADFDYSPYFSIIKYPILRFSENAPYHSYPWRNDLISNDEEIVENAYHKE